MVAVSGDRSGWKDNTNTTRAEKHMPLLYGDSVLDMAPVGTTLVAVDLVPDARNLVTFIHPESAFYIFGPEDGTLPKELVARCAHKIMIPTRYCMNLAATVNVVLYDRMAKGLL